MNMALASLLFPFFMMGIPVAVSIILVSIIAVYFFTSTPLMVLPQRMFVGLDSFPLMAIPFFILSGNIMASGGISNQLVDFARTIVGRVQGGLAATCVLTCLFFAAVSGSSIATTFAIGAVCKQLNTGGYVADITRAWLSPSLVPFLAFLVSCFIAFVV